MAFLDIKNGRIDAYVGDDSVLRCWNKSNKNSIYEVATVENKEFISNIAIAVKKGNHQLLKKINDGLSQLKRTNELEKIKASFLYMPKIEVYPLVIKIGKAIIITIKIAILSLIIGLVLSLVFWLLLILNSVTRTITSFITSIVRSIPELVTIMFTYFVLPVLIQKIFPSYSISPICSTSIGLALIFCFLRIKDIL